MGYLLEAVPQYKIRLGGRTLTLPLPLGNHLIGRMSDCWLTLDDEQCSRYHARLLVETDSLHVEDLDSSNGTFLNSVRIKKREPRAIGHGDSIQIGREVIHIISDGSTAPVEDPMDSLRKTIGPNEDAHFPQLISQLVQKSLKVDKLKEAERYALALVNQLMGAKVSGDHPTAKSCITCLIALASHVGRRVARPSVPPTRGPLVVDVGRDHQRDPLGAEPDHAHPRLRAR